MYDPKKAFIRGEDSHAASQSVPLHEALADMLTKNLNDATSTSVGKLVPLEISVRVLKHSIKFVAL